MLAYKCTNNYPVRVGKVRFGILSPDEIRRISTVEVKDTTIYCRGLPNPRGINDHRMGTVDRRLLCGTCCRDVRMCQGHVGHIELSFPMYHIGFFDTTFKTLRCVCFTCSRILLSDDEIKVIDNMNINGKQKFGYVYNIIKTRKKCCHCSFVQPTYTRSTLCIKADWNSDIDWQNPEEKEYCMLPFTQRDVLSILSHMTDEDVNTLGFNPEMCHPKHTIMLCILVCPPVARPAIMASEGSRSRGQDDLTHKLQDINKRSIELSNAMKCGWREVVITPELLERISRLQFEVFTYMNNNLRGQKVSTQRSGAPTKSLTDRLKGKDGRIRGNLMGKRVDFSARSVITPDAVMDIDQVGIPYKIAMSLTIPERVTTHNIKELLTRVLNGPTKMFGAENVITSTGTMINLSTCENRENIRLQYGWIVERFLQDDDIVIFNRQPSLHKMGMMGHRVKLMPGYTFRLNLCCANPYNADFDGDEMNLHVPQSPAAIADVATIMMVPKQIISPQANRPVMGIVQDTLLGSYLMSNLETFLTRKQACHIIALLKHTSKRLPEPVLIQPVEMWTGRQILSILFPSTFLLGEKSNTTSPSDNTNLYISQGQIMTGYLSKSSMGGAAGGVVDILYRDFGSSTTVNWMSDAQRLINAWLMMQGFSVGIRDCVLSAKGEERVAKRVNNAMKFAEELLDEKVIEGSYEATVLESTIVRILSKTLMQTGGIVDEELHPNNAIRSMVTAGSKGNPINLSQICGCVGQQSIEGHRVFAEKGGRTLPCFDENNPTLTSQGFCQNSYALGLQPYEYFFHAMGGREGLVDTAVKTATTGYIQRRQVKAMEDARIMYDGTVRNAEDTIIDFSYGGDGMDASRVERVPLNILKESDESIKARMSEWESSRCLHAKHNILKCKQMVLYSTLETRVLLPFNIKRILRQHVTYEETMLSSDEAKEIQKMVQDFVSDLESKVYTLAILDMFNYQHLVKLSIKPEVVDNMLSVIGKKILQSKVHPGEMVGSIAAQSIGEPATQMTLNTFHLSGVGNQSVTMGIPRLKELLDQSRNIKTPSNCIRALPIFEKNANFMSYLANTLPLTRLGDIVSSCNIFKDEDLKKTLMVEDQQMLDMDLAINGEDQFLNPSVYVVRLILNQNIMKTRCVYPPIIRSILRKRLKSMAHIVSTETNSVDWIIRIRFNHLKEMVDVLENVVQSKHEREAQLCHKIVSCLLDTVAVCGNQRITGAFMREKDNHDNSNEKKYIIDTQGCALLDFIAAPCIDWYRCTSNDVTEIHDTLGLEAAVNVLYSELASTLSFDGTYVDPRHIMMVVNTMTRGGYIMPLSRHGINRMDTGPFIRCSFEETPDILCEAAVFGETDNGKGVSQNIMTGKLATIGSGMPSIQMTSNSMHPRTINLQKSSSTARVLKSSVRRRNNIMEDTMEFMEVKHRDGGSGSGSKNSEGHTIMPPFNSFEKNVSMIDSDVFSTPFCKDTMSTDMYERPIAKPKRYRPSSPDLNDD